MSKKIVLPVLSVLSCLLFLSFYNPNTNPYPADILIEPAQLIKLLEAKTSESKPLILNVGSMELIKTAETGGLGSMLEGMEKFRARVNNENRNRMIVLYCGCCTLDHCPNVKPPYDYLIEKGFKNVKILNLTTGLYEDWISKGFPMAK